MANTIQLKRSSVPGKVPDSANVEVGEPLVNLVDRVVYTKDVSGNVIKVAAGNLQSLSDVSNTIPILNQVLSWDGTKWEPSNVSSTSGVTSVAGAIGIVSNTQLAAGITTSGLLTTANVTELDNLYYTNARVYSNVTQLGYITSSALNGYATNSQLTAYALNTDLTTANVVEDGNLYYTVARANTAIDNRVTKTFVENLNISVANTQITGKLQSSQIISVANSQITGDILLGTQTSGAYVANLVAGTGVALSGLGNEGTTPTIALATSGVTANTYGGASNVPVIQVDQYGRITSAANVNVAGVTNFAASGNTFTISTADGGSFSASIQENSVRLGTDTTGVYVANLVQGTGISLTNLAGEGATPTVALATSGVTAATYGNATLIPSITVDQQGRITGASNVAISVPSGSITGDIVLGTQTSGAYVANLVAGNGVTLTGLGNEGTTPTIAIGQPVATTSDVQFAKVNATGQVRITDATISSGAATGALIVTGGASVGGNLFISGNLTVVGSTTTHNSNTLIVNDPMIYLAENNTSDVLDIGVVGSFTNPGYQHAGFVRDASDGVWKLFANVVTEPTSVIDFTNATYSAMQIGALTATTGTFTGNVTTGNVSGTVGTFTNSRLGTVQTGTWQGSSISTTYTDAKIVSVANTAPISATTSGGAVTVEHLNSGVSATTYGGTTQIPVYVVNSTGHITSASNVTVQVANTNITGNIISSQIAPTGVSASTYGGSTKIPVVVIDQQGRITSAANVDVVGGVSSVGGASGDVSNVQLASSISRATVPNVTISGNITANVYLDTSNRRLLIKNAAGNIVWGD